MIDRTQEIVEAVTSNASAALEELRRRFLTDWLAALDEFNAVSEALAAGVHPATRAAIDAAAAAKLRGEATAGLIKSWQGLLDTAYRQAYHEGQTVWGRGRPLPRGLSPAAERVLKREKQFAFRFATDVAAGPKAGGKAFPFGHRSAMYGLAVEGGFHRGAVDGSPPGQLIWWRLGDARHCVDCPNLAANSPYTKETLPTVPRAGSTTCWTSCKCHLEFSQAAGTRRVTEPEPPDPEETLDDRERARDLKDRVEGPKPKAPPGYRLPTERENRQIQDIRHRMAFANRRADRAYAAGNIPERDRWLGIRSDLNGRLIDLQETGRIWAPPTFSDKEILTSADLRAGDVDWLTHLRGIDGTTIHRAQASAIEQSVAAAKESMADLLRDLPPGGGPVVPDFDDLLRRAGAPRSSFTGSFDDALRLPPDPHALCESVQVADPADELIVSVVGLGAVATLAIIPLAFEECRARELRLVFGPCDEGWQDVALLTGVWIAGEGEDVRALVAALSRRVGGRGLEIATWQP